jgi:hypothetical protein
MAPESKTKHQKVFDFRKTLQKLLTLIAIFPRYLTFLVSSLKDHTTFNKKTRHALSDKIFVSLFSLQLLIRFDLIHAFFVKLSIVKFHLNFCDPFLSKS